MTYFRLVSLIFAFLSTAVLPVYARSLLLGTIQFTPQSQVHPIRVYYGGKIISTHAHNSKRTEISFDIAKTNTQNKFYLLVVQDSAHHLKEVATQKEVQNTIDHLHAADADSYRFFVLDLVQNTHDTSDQSMEALLKAEQLSYHWEINEEKLTEDGKIPDSTIVVYYFPDSIKEIKGGSSLELPTIIVDNTHRTTELSAQDADDALIRLQLAALNTDPIHAPSKRKIKTVKHSLLIMDIA